MRLKRYEKKFMKITKDWLYKFNKNNIINI